MKRGYILDQLMSIGHLEASLTHTDEEVVNSYEDLSSAGEDFGKVSDIANSLNDTRERAKRRYLLRAFLLDDIFTQIPNSNRKMLCEIKHDAADYVMLAEVYHARGFDENSEKALVEMGKILALSCSAAFGLEPLECLRCLNDTLNSKLGFDALPVPDSTEEEQEENV